MSSSPPSVPTDSHSDHAKPYDDFHDFLRFPFPTSDHHHDFHPLVPSVNGDGFEEDSVRMRRRREDDVAGASENEEDGGVKRARFDATGSPAEVNGNELLDFDLNDHVGYIRVDETESVRGFLYDDDYAVQFESLGKEVVCVDSCGGGGGVDVNVSNQGEFHASGEENVIEADISTELKLGMVDVTSLCDGSSSSQRRYTREEKGKGILDHNWLSIAIENHRMAYSERDETDVSGRGDRNLRNDAEWNEASGVANEQSEVCFVPFVNGGHSREPEEYLIQDTYNGFLLPQSNLEPPIKHKPATYVDNNALFRARINANIRRGERRKNKKIAKDYANNLANSKQLSEAESPRHEIQETTGPFSFVMRKILDQKQQKPWQWTQQKSFSIEWKPSRTHGSKLRTQNIPSLLDLSLNVLAKNFESIVSLESLPDALRWRISQAACDNRKMDSHLLEMLVTESSTEIYVKDCSWMNEEQFNHIFRELNTKYLTVLQLDLCGQALTEDTLGTTLAQSKNGLPALVNLSVKSACRLTDNGLISIVELAPSLQSINLSQCSLLTSLGISKLASCLRSMLKELYIDDCLNIDAMDISRALLKFKHLEVLSVSGIHTVSDEFIRQFVCYRGSKLREIGLANCAKLTDSSLKAIGQACPGLCALDISFLDQLTDATLEYIANGCRSIQKLKCCRNSFSDEAMASFLEVSGQSLKELSVNHISKVDTYTALSLAKHSRSLLVLDLSWCRKLTDAAVGLIVDSCLSLRLLKLFGCTQLTDVFLNGHSNPNVEIIGLKNMLGLKQVSTIDTQPGPLRYSQLITSQLS